MLHGLLCIHRSVNRILHPASVVSVTAATSISGRARPARSVTRSGTHGWLPSGSCGRSLVKRRAGAFCDLRPQASRTETTSHRIFRFLRRQQRRFHLPRTAPHQPRASLTSRHRTPGLFSTASRTFRVGSPVARAPTFHKRAASSAILARGKGTSNLSWDGGSTGAGEA